MNRLGALGLWVALLAVGFGVGPPNRPDLGAFVADLLLGRWAGHPAWVVAEFQAMGLWPMLVGLQIRGDWRARVPAWPFVLASFGLGCYALLPWFVLRSGARGEASAGGLGSPVAPALLGLAAAALLVGAVATGDPRELAHAFATDGFVWAMSWDFLAFWLVSLAEARARSRGTPWWLCAAPLVGTAAFLVLESRAREA